jgi:hypothetical protein
MGQTGHAEILKMFGGQGGIRTHDREDAKPTTRPMSISIQHQWIIIQQDLKLILKKMEVRCLCLVNAKKNNSRWQMALLT